MENTQQSRNASSYTIRFDRTLKALQDRVKEQEAVLEKLRATTAPIAAEPSLDPKYHLQQLRTLKAVYVSLTPTEPWLPAPESPLPALLALRNTDKCIKETRESITETEEDLKTTTQQLEKEQADLHVARLIQNALQTRTTSLQEQIMEQTQKSPAQIAKDMIREVSRKTTYYDGETGKLVKAFNEFIDEHLAVMLAAEELGGPIVGEDLDLDDAALERGFSTQGKAKRGKSKVDEDKRQRRIDEIWGSKPPENEKVKEPWNEKQAAAAEMRELTEQLLNTLVEAEGSGPGAYVDLQRESAAARFLVRSKVAQFHPKDARKLRLLDFGGELNE